MKLILDFGNTLQKLAVFDANQMIAFKSFKKISLSAIQNFISEYNINSAVLSSVIDYPQNINSYLSENFFFIELTEKTKVPIINNYLSPDTLGKDRLAAVVAASFLYKKRNVLVVNAGTCITYDFIDHNSEYFGGAISPGINIRFKALHTFTGKLPLVKKKNKTPLVGNSTEKSILSGVINGATAEYEAIVSKYNDKYSDLIVILSGGDMKYFEKKIKNSIFAFPNIVLFGLNIILDFNAKN